MTKKTQQTYIAIAIIVVIIAGVWLAKRKPNSNSGKPDANASLTKDESPLSSTTPSNAKTWEGKLLASNNPKKGNLMLQTKDRLVYIRTSRDFSSLVGKDVVVSYEGDYSSFVLGDIVQK